MNNFDAKKVKNEIVQWIKDWFNENGKGCCAVVGISGGKDSSVVAALCVEALGKDRVFGVLMPQGEQSDIDFSYKLVRHLDINNCIVNIGDTISTLTNEVKPKLNNQWSKQTSTNLPARIRMATLYAVSQTINGRVANTCNLSETLLSWETRWGDALGFKYSVMDKYIRTGEIDNTDIKNIIDERVKKYQFKRMPIPYFSTGLKRYVD